MSPRNDMEEWISSLNLPSDFPVSPSTRNLLVVTVDNKPLQHCHIISRVDVSTFCRNHPKVLKKWVTKISALKRALHPLAIPLGVPLDELAEHPNATRIYHRLFKVFRAYRRILLDILFDLTNLDPFRAAKIAEHH